MKNYLSILRGDDSSSADEIKKRYRELVKQNHPDLFPPDKRREQNLVLMEINEAYLCLMGNNDAPVKQTAEAAPSMNSSIVLHKDPAYAYYKSAIDHLNSGNYIFNWSRYSPKGGRYHFDVRKSSLLQTAADALEHFRAAYSSFLKVCTGYPDSVWAKDSMDKLDVIEKLNGRYHEIIERLMNVT